MKSKQSSSISAGMIRSNDRYLNSLLRSNNEPKLKISKINNSSSNVSKHSIHDGCIDNQSTRDNVAFDYPDDEENSTIENCYFEEDITSFQENEMLSIPVLEKTHDKVSAIELRIPSFDMKRLAKHLTILSNSHHYLLCDDGQKLNSGGKVRKGSLARALYDWSLEYNVPSVGVDALMNIMYHTFDGSDLPVKKKFNQSTAKSFETLEEFKQHNEIGNEFTCSSGVELDVLDDESTNSVDKEDDDVDNENASLCTEDLRSSSTGVVKSAIREYSQKSTRYVAVDQCICDGYVFAGDNNGFVCPVCNTDRFRPCTRSLCPGKGNKDCEHLRSNDGDGIAYKQLFYRPLLVLISDLLKTPNFLRSLRYERVYEISHKRSRTFSDLMDGDVVQRHLFDMKARYDAWCLLKQRVNPPEEVSLVLSEFYDGAQLFKSKTSNFWVLMTQILNLPPSFRGKIGIGMFLSAIYAGKHIEAEKFLFTDMYCEELRLLYDGTELVLKGKRYFIQARLILHTLDTKALEAVVGLQSVGMALYGCPLCRGVTGVQDGGKCVYIGHRHLLPQNSYLRFLGQSGKCCPAGFYTNDKSCELGVESYEHGFDSFSIEDHEGYKNIRTSIQNEMVKRGKTSGRKYSQMELDDKYRTEVWESIRNTFGVKQTLQFCLPCDKDKRRELTIQKFLFLHEHVQYFWSHGTPQLWQPIVFDKAAGLRKVLVYRHFDFRPHKPYSRVSYSDHLVNAIQAKQLNDDNKTLKKKHLNGIQDVWSFERLPYANITNQVTWPFLHSVTGVIKLLINSILGCKDVKESTVKETKNIGELYNNNASSSDDDENKDGKSKNEENKSTTIPLTRKEKMKRIRETKQATFYAYRPLNSKSAKPPFVCTTSDKKRCREWLQCIILPRGLGEDSWDMKSFIINEKKPIPGFMKMNQRMKLISCFWDFILFAMYGVEDLYKVFFQIVGLNLTKLQSNYFSLEDVTQLSRDIEEMVCLWEGVLPLKTCTMILHELIDLAPFIIHFGPPMGVSEYPGERAVGAVINRKLKCNAGGESFENMVADRHINYELQKMKNFYSNNDLSKLDNGSCEYNSDNGKCIYNGERYSISKPEAKTSQVKNSCNSFSDYEIDHLVDTLMLEIQRKYGEDNHDICFQSSVVYKLQCKRRIDKKNRSVSDWLRYVIQNESGDFGREEVLVAQNLLHFQPTYYQNALISGLTFQSRGSWKREIERPKQNRYGSEKPDFRGSNSSDLSHSYRDKKDNSSWCIYQQPKLQKRYAQINMFFQVHIGDASLDGVCLASVTSRNHLSIAKTNLVKIRRQESLDIDTLFVSTKDLYPTRIGTIPFSNNWKAIRTRAKAWSQTIYSTSDQGAEFTEMIMFTLHPEKLCFRFLNE